LRPAVSGAIVLDMSSRQPLGSGAPRSAMALNGLARSTAALRHERTRVLAEDPGLGDQLEPAGFQRAVESSVANVMRAPVGAWDPPPREAASGWLGLLVLEGILARRLTVEGRTWTELLGTGDVLQPWTCDSDDTGLVPATADWEIVSPVRVAVLDSGFAMRMSPWPAVPAELIGRVVQRARSLAYAIAACGRIGVADRVLLMLRHYASRWGRMTPEGIVVHLPGLTHEVLARQIGAARPSVTTALATLRERRLVRGMGGGRWLVAPPEARDR
jgi:CRP/FNR family transcriptional regulator, cyclic AMP receptor protein